MPDLDQIFEKEGRKGSSINILQEFANGFNKLYNEHKENTEPTLSIHETHPLFVEMKKIVEQKKFADIMAPKRINIKEEFATKHRKKCDEVFAEYLGFIAEKSSDSFFRDAVKFILMYREHMNKNGDKLEESKKTLPESVVLPKIPGAVPEKPTATEFCLENNAEQAPDISNDFINSYLPENIAKAETNIDDMKDLTYHFCGWLFYNCFTCTLVSMANSIKDDNPENEGTENNLEDESEPMDHDSEQSEETKKDENIPKSENEHHENITEIRKIPEEETKNNNIEPSKNTEEKPIILLEQPKNLEQPLQNNANVEKINTTEVKIKEEKPDIPKEQEKSQKMIIEYEQQKISQPAKINESDIPKTSLNQPKIEKAPAIVEPTKRLPEIHHKPVIKLSMEPPKPISEPEENILPTNQNQNQDQNQNQNQNQNQQENNVTNIAPNGDQIKKADEETE